MDGTPLLLNLLGRDYVPPDATFGDWATPNQWRAGRSSSPTFCWSAIRFTPKRNLSMKLVVAIIRPERLSQVQKALKSVNVERVNARKRAAHPDTRIYSSPTLRVEIFTRDRKSTRLNSSH